MTCLGSFRRKRPTVGGVTVWVAGTSAGAPFRGSLTVPPIVAVTWSVVVTRTRTAFFLVISVAWWITGGHGALGRGADRAEVLGLVAVAVMVGVGLDDPGHRDELIFRWLSKSMTGPDFGEAGPSENVTGGGSCRGEDIAGGPEAIPASDRDPGVEDVDPPPPAIAGPLSAITAKPLPPSEPQDLEPKGMNSGSGRRR